MIRENGFLTILPSRPHGASAFSSMKSGFPGPMQTVSNCLIPRAVMLWSLSQRAALCSVYSSWHSLRGAAADLHRRINDLTNDPYYAQEKHFDSKHSPGVGVELVCRLWFSAGSANRLLRGWRRWQRSHARR